MIKPRHLPSLALETGLSYLICFELKSVASSSVLACSVCCLAQSYTVLLNLSFLILLLMSQLCLRPSLFVKSHPLHESLQGESQLNCSSLLGRCMNLLSVSLSQVLALSVSKGFSCLCSVVILPLCCARNLLFLKTGSCFEFDELLFHRLQPNCKQMSRAVGARKLILFILFLILTDFMALTVLMKLIGMFLPLFRRICLLCPFLL